MSALLIFASIAADGASLRKVWDFRVSGVTGEDAAPRVYALGFSRDGQQIAALIGRSSRDQSILTVDSHDPLTQHFKLDVNLRAPKSDRRIEWSLSGQKIVLGNLIVDVRTGSACSLPDGGWAIHWPKSGRRIPGRPSALLRSGLPRRRWLANPQK